ncbi:hypothetical protein RN001_003146 [Aquatica leii]|uniref:Uncharacterized protein n=1 Tax=Aquatica leii TaxID=1421715 RepID=A0AAN7SSZ1_9COLE|nr:hypothetical protein RN001_003146 [Aquatica leii]
MSRSRINMNDSKQDKLNEDRSKQFNINEENDDNEDRQQADDKCNLFTSSRFCDLLKMIAESENEERFLSSNYNRIDLTALGPRQYLEETVVPILMEALQFLVKERPPEPINALCVYLLKYKSKFEKFCNTEPPSDDKDECI